MATINNREYDWSSIEVRTDGDEPLVAINAITFSWTVERTMVQGAGRRPLGMTRGRFVPGDASITFHRSAYDSLAASPGWCDRDRVIVIQYTDSVLGTRREVLSGVRFSGAQGGGEQGTDALTVQVNFQFRGLTINGASPIEDTSVSRQVV